MTDLGVVLAGLKQERDKLERDATPPKNESETPTAPTAHPLWRCPECGGPMAVVERFTAAQLQLRSPPLLATAA